MVEVEDKTKQTYDEMLKCSVGDPTALHNIYMANRNFMNPDTIDAIVLLGSKRSFTFSDFTKFSRLMALPTFEAFSTATPGDDQYMQLYSVICEYLKAIAVYRKKNFSTLRQNVMFWLRSKIEQPVANTMNPTSCRVNVKSSFKPEEGTQITVYNDLVRKATEQAKALSTATVHTFNYTPRSASVQMLPHTIVQGLVTKIVNMQTSMKREASAQNLKIPPFLDIIPSSKLGGELNVRNH